MHYVVIWQEDPEVEVLLRPMLDLGVESVVTAVNGHHVRFQRMVSSGAPKGEWFDRAVIFAAIFTTAQHALQTPDRAAAMQVMFIFHQTSRAAVNAIMAALDMLRSDVLDNFALSIPKDFQVPQVILMSCESAADKVVPAPVPPALAPWVEQASKMRQACFDAFTIKQRDGVTEFPPNVVTFSTGNLETGGVVLNPWQSKFVSLRGHFNPDGTWDYELDANGQPDHTPTDAAGTLYVDSPSGSSSTHPFPAGQSIPPFLP